MTMIGYFEWPVWLEPCISKRTQSELQVGKRVGIWFVGIAPNNNLRLHWPVSCLKESFAQPPGGVLSIEGTHIGEAFGW